MRLVVGILAIIIGLNAQNVDNAIKKNQAKIQKNIKEQDRISAKIKELGKQISFQNNELKSLVDEIQILEKEIEDNQGKFLEEEKEFKLAKNRSDELHKRNMDIQSQITKLIAQELAFRVIVSDKQPTSSEDIVLSELFGALSKNAKTSIASLTDEKKKIGVEIQEISKKMQALQGVIKQQNQRRTKLQEGVKRSNVLIAKLEKDLKAYDERMSKIAQERRNLDEILEQLNIRKQNEKRKDIQKKDEAKTQIAKKDRVAPLDVRRMGSSYRQVSTMHYRGRKTIAPLDTYAIEQRFGTYFDPVYKIKVFNESVILSPKKANSNVKNVMDGKVVFAKETPVLKKVVIIEHANQMHTIYAYLDKIAPTIRPGLRIKRGYIIGKVNERLGFEVTQKDKHIDPLELIQ
ncbi:murein hydrolase activator EnvC family protein [Helicobacter kayseriensis]|uniref:murein hydrolase activator EnvC family protein n=1 Tax=Helicobacter kayseriensis TaxID=2905877 RepID=UPI001E30F6B3|nr:peptidoglycan DD-metalloendopeptidase family protein [Helicobacter kayseriensis]MCE3048950.1 peptidoglycan DD-metalloendopeptidase family protein [Helicobacter kayseriensis]